MKDESWKLGSRFSSSFILPPSSLLVFESESFSNTLLGLALGRVAPDRLEGLSEIVLTHSL